MAYLNSVTSIAGYILFTLHGVTMRNYMNNFNNVNLLSGPNYQYYYHMDTFAMYQQGPRAYGADSLVHTIECPPRSQKTWVPFMRHTDQKT